jgi:hypothetical protein
MLLTSNRWKHFAAMVLIGDGVMAIVRPTQDAKAWARGPRIWKKWMHRLDRRPSLTRMIGIAQVAGGIYWAITQED